MKAWTRRCWLGAVSSAGLGALAVSRRARAGDAEPRRRMTLNLVCGMIGVTADQVKAIELAQRHGYESVEAQGGYLASLSEDGLSELKEKMRARGVVFGAAGLPVDFRQDEERFARGLRELPKIAAALRRAGVDRMGTWISPAHDTLT